MAWVDRDRFSMVLIDRDVPTYADSEGSLPPIAVLYYGHFSMHIRAGPVEDLVGVTVVCR